MGVHDPDAIEAAERPAGDAAWWWHLVAVAGLIGLLAVGGYLRSVDLAERPLWGDEAYSWWVAEPQDFGAMARHVTREPHHPPGSFMAIALSMQAFDTDAEWAVRLPSLAAGTAAVVAAYALGAAVGGPLIAFAVAAFAALDPLLIQQSQQARMFAMFCLTQTLAMALGVGLFRRPRAGPWPWALLGVVLAAGLWLSYLAAVVWVGLVIGAVCLIPALARRPLDRPDLGRPLAPAASGFALAMVFAAGLSYLSIVSLVEYAAAGADRARVMTYAESAAECFDTLIHLYGPVWVSVPWIVAGVAGWVVLCRRHAVAAGVIVPLSLVALAIPIEVRTGYHFSAPRFFMAALPGLWLGAAVLTMSGRRPATRGAGAAALVGLLTLAVFGHTTVNDAWPEYVMTGRIARTLHGQTDVGDGVEAYPTWNESVVLYYRLPISPRSRFLEDDAWPLGVASVIDDTPGDWYVLCGHQRTADVLARTRAHVARAIAAARGRPATDAELAPLQLGRVGVYRLSAERTDAWFTDRDHPGLEAIPWQRLDPPTADR